MYVLGACNNRIGLQTMLVCIPWGTLQQDQNQINQFENVAILSLNH